MTQTLPCPSSTLARFHTRLRASECIVCMGYGDAQAASVMPSELLWRGLVVKNRRQKEQQRDTVSIIMRRLVAMQQAPHAVNTTANAKVITVVITDHGVWGSCLTLATRADGRCCVINCSVSSRVNAFNVFECIMRKYDNAGLVKDFYILA